MASRLRPSSRSARLTSRGGKTRASWDTQPGGQGCKPQCWREKRYSFMMCFGTDFRPGWNRWLAQHCSQLR